MLADLQVKLEEQMAKVNALEEAEALRAVKPSAPGTRPNMFQTPASSNNLAARSPEGSDASPYSLMQQMQSAGDSLTFPAIPAAPAAPKSMTKASLSGAALAGKAVAKFEEEKRDAVVLGDSTGHAFMVLVNSFWKFVVSGKAGKTLLFFFTFVVYQNRKGIRRAAKSKSVELLAALAVLAQWAFANTVLSAQTAFSIKATQFFQGGLTYFGGQVSAQVTESKGLPDQAATVLVTTDMLAPPATVPVEVVMEAHVPTPPPQRPSEPQPQFVRHEAEHPLVAMLAGVDLQLSNAYAKLVLPLPGSQHDALQMQIADLSAARSRLVLIGDSNKVSVIDTKLRQATFNNSAASAPIVPGAPDAPPQIAKSFTPTLESVPGSPMSPSPNAGGHALEPQPMSELGAGARDAELRNRKTLSSQQLSQPPASALLGSTAAERVTSFDAISSPSLHAGGQGSEVVAVAPQSPPVPDSESPAVVPGTGNGEKLLMMWECSQSTSLAEVVECFRARGGGVAMSDDGCTFTAMLDPIGRIEHSFIKQDVPVTIGDAKSLNFKGTDLYCCQMGGRGDVSYDVLFRAGTYPAGGIGNVMSGTVLRKIFDMKSTPAGGLQYSLDNQPALFPIVAPNSTAFLTLLPLAGPRCAALYRKAIDLGMDARDIHFMCVSLSPNVVSGGESLMASIASRSIRGSLVENPEAIDLFSGPYARNPSYCNLLEANGVRKATPYDNDPVYGGGKADCIHTQTRYLDLQQRADNGEIGYAHLGPSCKFTMVGRILDRNQGKEDPKSRVMRERGHVLYGRDLPQDLAAVLRQDSNMNLKAAAIAISVGRNGGIVTFETQADRDDPSRPDVFWTGADGHVNLAHLPCYVQMFEVLGMQRATTDLCAWEDDAGRNVWQKSSDWWVSPALMPTFGHDLADARCGCGMYGHSASLGKGADGKFNTHGSGPYPNGLIACAAAHVGAWFAGLVPVDALQKHNSQTIASFINRTAAMERPRGAAAGPFYEGLELLILVHVETFHASERLVVNAITIMGLRHRIKPEHLVAYRKWKCAICATVLGRRRAFSARPHDATLPHPGKVWQVDSVAYRFAPWYAAIFCDVATHVSYTYEHATTSSDHMVLVMSRHRAQIRPTHGEIEVILSDPLTAMRSRDVQSYAADEQVTGHGKGFSLKVGPQGVHEWVSICENQYNDRGVWPPRCSPFLIVK